MTIDARTQVFTLLNDVRQNYGGMTKAAFRRSEAIAGYEKLPVRILTFDEKPNYPAIEAEIRTTGELEHCRLLNFCCAVAALSESKEFARHVANNVKALPAKPRKKAKPQNSDAYAVANEETDEVSTRSYFSRRGLFMTIETTKVAPKRETVTYFHQGGLRRRAVYQGSLGKLKELWLDYLIGEDQAMLVIDDNRIGRLFKTYTRPNVGKLFVQHTSHLEVTNASDLEGMLRKSYADVFRNLGTFDSVISTNSFQNKELVRRLGPATLCVTIPNVNAVPDLPADTNRNARRGVVLTRHSAEKNVEATVRAFERAYRAGAVDLLTVIGSPQSGIYYDRARALVKELNIGDVVSFEGHDSNAASRYWNAGFTVLSSDYEGFGLVLVEAMSCGAVPVTFDTLFGPRSLITDGENGFVAAQGNIEELGDAIISASKISEGSGFRQRLMEFSHSFSGEIVSRMWVDLFNRVAATFAVRAQCKDLNIELTAVSRSGDTSNLEFSFRGFDVSASSSVKLVLQGFSSFETVLIDGSWTGQNAHSFEVPDGVRAAFRDPSVTVYVELSFGEYKHRQRIKWPESWPKSVVTRTKAGNLNL